VPMLRMGDELAHSQSGNNNAYCQDNDVSWIDWSAADDFPPGGRHELVDLVTRLLTLRRDHPVFRQRAFFHGRPVHPDGVKDIAWFTPSGEEMNDGDWASASARTLGMFLSGEGIRTRGPRGERIVDDSFLALLHAGEARQDFCVPGSPWSTAYIVELDTADPEAPAGRVVRGGETLSLVPRSLVLLRACG
jgi:isoamylase